VSSLSILKAKFCVKGIKIYNLHAYFTHTQGKTSRLRR